MPWICWPPGLALSFARNICTLTIFNSRRASAVNKVWGTRFDCKHMHRWSGHVGQLAVALRDSAGAGGDRDCQKTFWGA